jgi:hypothetical protein
MKQYRITSEHFVPQGETGDADAVMDPNDLRELKRLSGIPISEDMGDNGAGQVAGLDFGVPQAGEDVIQSPVGSNISVTASERNALLHDYNAKPGTDLWFLINFTKPYLNGSLRAHVEDYLKKHPEYRQRPAPGQ